MKKLLLISNHQITTYGFELLLKSTNSNIEVYTVSNDSMALNLLASDTFDLLVTILEPNTAEIAGKLIKACPNIRILAITNNIGMSMVQRLYHVGLKGVVDITNHAETIMHAVEAVLAGQTFLEEKFKEYLLQIPTTTAPISKTAFDVLTKREEQVIGLMLKGKKMGEISASLNLKPSTVSTFKTKIYEKLGVSSVLELQQVCFPQQ